jgi:hypothetical protein
VVKGSHFTLSFAVFFFDHSDRSVLSAFISGKVLPFNFGDFWHSWHFWQFFPPPCYFVLTNARPIPPTPSTSLIWLTGLGSSANCQWLIAKCSWFSHLRLSAKSAANAFQFRRFLAILAFLAIRLIRVDSR